MIKLIRELIMVVSISCAVNTLIIRFECPNFTETQVFKN